MSKRRDASVCAEPLHSGRLPAQFEAMAMSKDTTKNIHILLLHKHIKRILSYSAFTHGYSVSLYTDDLFEEF